MFTGCTSFYQRVDLEDSLNGAKLEKNKGVFISMPPDGSYGNTKYAGSGSMTVQAVQRAFARYTNTIKLSACLKRDECLTEAVQAKSSYQVFPEILHWEDRATEWSMLPDRIEIKFIVIDVSSNKVVNSVILKGESKISTWGGDHPVDLLQEPIDNYVSTLY